jgi:peptide deformylase
MILEIMKFGNPILRSPGAPVGPITEAVRELAANMIETMREAHGVGLAAQQVGVAIQLAIMDVGGIEDRPSEMRIAGEPVATDEEMPMVLLNPSLDLGPEKDVDAEGCLSFPEMTGDISRSTSIRVRGQLLDGRLVDFEADGFLARVIQHEVDHLHGVLFIDRMSSAARSSLSGRLKRLKTEGEQQARRGKGPRPAKK